MAAPSLAPEAVLGSSSPALAFQSSSQCVCVAGQRLKFSACHAPLEPDETRWVQSSGPHSIAVVATCPRAKLFAYTEKTLEPKISVCSYPDFMPVTALEWSTRLEFTALAFSRDGSQLAALTGLPEPTLVVWDLRTGAVLASGPLVVPCNDLSFNPSGDGSLCTLAPKRLLVWKLQLVYKTYLLESKEIPLDEAADDEAEAANATWTSHCWSPGNALYASSDVGGVVRLAIGSGGAPTLVLRCSTGVSALVADSTHLLVGCADGSVRWYSPSGDEELDEESSLLWSLSLDSAIKSLVYAPDCLKLLAATDAGETHLVKYTQESLPLEALPASRVLTSEKVSAFHTASVVAATLLPVLDTDAGQVSGYDLVSCSADGTLRCIDALTRLEVARTTTTSSSPPSALAACSASMLIALGTADGVLRLYHRRLDQMPLLLLVWRGRLSTSPVERLAFSADGAHLAAACADGTLLFLHLPKGCDAPTILPFYTCASAPTALAWTSGGKLLAGFADGPVKLIGIPSGAAGEEASLNGTPSITLASAAIDLLEAPSTYAGAGGGGATTFFVACEDYGVHVYDMPASGGGKAAAKESPLSFQASGKRPCTLTLSLDGGFLGIGGADGSLSVSPMDNLGNAATVPLHDSLPGGTAAVCLAPDLSPGAVAGACLAYTYGKDGTMYLTTVAPGGYGDRAPLPTIVPMPTALRGVPDAPTGSTTEEEAQVAAARAEVEQEAEGDGASPPPPVTPDVKATDAKPELTVVELAKVASAAGMAESAARDAIGVKVEGLREELMAIIGANEMLADDDLEKLKPTDFIIDLAQQADWREEGTKQVQALHESIAHENLSNELVRARMLDEFWNAMEAPAVTLHSLAVPGQGAPSRQTLPKVTSYTVPQPLETATKTLGAVKLLRRVELLVDAWEGKDLNDPAPAYLPATSFENAPGFAHDIGKVLSAADIRAAAAAAAEAAGGDAKETPRDGKKDGEEPEPEAEEGEGEGEGKKGDAKLLYQPFELHTRWRKVSQMSLQGEAQLMLKREFNDKLKALVNYKRGELEKVKERQVRIGEIETELGKLGAASDGEPTLEMLMHPEEEPEKVLEVAESEITAEKYISPAEKERIAKAEEEKRLRDEANAKDNLGQRGLVAMMNGTLETRRDEDEIFTDLVRPEWMDEKPPEEMSEDERGLVKEFEDKVKKLQAERDKRSKGLLTELAKLRLEIQDCCNNFNERVKALKETKVQFDSALYESELLVIRLGQARLHLEKFEKHSAELETELVEQTQAASTARAKLAVFNVELTAQAELVETLTNEDKALDKAFKKDFADVPDFFEALRKLFLRRTTVKVPLGTKDGSKNKDKKKAPAQGARAGGLMVAVQSRPGGDGADGSGGSEDVAVAGGRDPYGELDQPQMEDMVEGLDPAVDMPEGLSFDVWDRLVEARNVKLRAEDSLSEATTILTAMQEYQAMLASDDDRLHQRIEVLESTLSDRKAQQLRGAWNLELPFKLKQGQVEVEEAAVVTDYGNALLVHRKEVTSLNAEIRKLGAEKVVILKEIRDFRKGIVQLEWENARADMEADDLVERTKEFQLLRVTKDLQEKIRGGGEDNHAGEVAALEKKLEQLKASHEDKVADLRRQVAKINAMIADRNNEMASLQGQIEQLEGSVLEREMIHEIQNQNADSSKDGYKKFEEMHMKRKLQTLVGMQTQEIGLLRDELDRLRRRTFPTFTHIDHRASSDRAL